MEYGWELVVLLATIIVAHKAVQITLPMIMGSVRFAIKWGLCMLVWKSMEGDAIKIAERTQSGWSWEWLTL